jgi:hypothetical protein
MSAIDTTSQDDATAPLAFAKRYRRSPRIGLGLRRSSGLQLFVDIDRLAPFGVQGGIELRYPPLGADLAATTALDHTWNSRFEEFSAAARVLLYVVEAVETGTSA